MMYLMPWLYRGAMLSILCLGLTAFFLTLGAAGVAAFGACALSLAWRKILE